MDTGRFPGIQPSLERVVAAYLPSENFIEIWVVERYDPLYGFDNKRLYHTDNWGASWDVFHLQGEIKDLMFSPDFPHDPSFYVLARGSLFKTSNFGADWQLLSKEPLIPNDGYSTFDFDQLEEPIKSPGD